MSRESRILLFVAALSLLAVLVLGAMARRYARLLDEHKPPAVRTEHR